jgi:integrase
VTPARRCSVSCIGSRGRHRRAVTLAELVEEYLDQHEAEPETTAKLRWLLSKSVARFGTRPLDELEAREIAAWRMTIPAGHRFEATQALRQVLARAVLWQLIDSNPAKLGVTNPVPVRREMRPFETWDEINAVATAIGPRDAPLVIFAAATGLRPGEWIALEHRDIDREANVVHVRRAYRNGRVKTTKTCNSTRPSRCSRSPSAPSIACRPTRAPRRWSFLLPRAATSTCTTSATATGNRPSTPPASSRYDGSTICATRSPPSRCAPDSRPLTCRGTWARA